MITKEQYDMIDMIIQGTSIAAIARKLNKSRTTLYLWLKLDEINKEMENRKTDMKNAAKDKIIINVDKCVNNILELANQAKDPRVKLQANKYLLDQAIGSPSATKEETNAPEGKYKDKDKNDLKRELDEIKKLTVIK